MTIRHTAEELRNLTGTVDWDAVNATTEEEIERQAIEDGYPIDETDWSKAIVCRPASYYRELRARMGDLSHAEFATRLGMDEQTVRNWELGCAAPEGPAEVLLQILESEPEVVARALAARVA